MIAGVVLAAGRSARLGRPKQLLPYRERPLLEWALAAMAQSMVDETIVVLGHDAARIQAEVDLHGARVAYNARYVDGLSTSLHAGLAALGADVTAAVLTVGDQPLLDAGAVDALIALHTQTDAPIIATDYGAYQGTPLLLHRALWPLAARVHGDQGARALLRAYPDAIAAVPVSPALAADIDTWEDYVRLRKNNDDHRARVDNL